MSTASWATVREKWPSRASIQRELDYAIESAIGSLPAPQSLSADQRRGIIARYAAVLEGNFIYWMTGALIGARSEEARTIILENLHEEVRDCHPGMLRKFAIAAGAAPTESDAMAVLLQLTNVRLFVSRMSPVPSLVMMTFFEGFIQRFMDFLAVLAGMQGSSELEYTDVHGICDIGHTQGLFRALETEMAVNTPESDAELFEGVGLLRTLIQSIVHSQ